MEKDILNVIKFQEALGVKTEKSPIIIDERVKLRVALLDEEYNEYLEALDKKDVVELMDATGDMIYILFGTAQEFGFAHLLPFVFNEIHRSNMSKFVNGKPVFNSNGKLTKGKNFKKPNLVQYVVANNYYRIMFYVMVYGETIFYAVIVLLLIIKFI